MPVVTESVITIVANTVISDSSVDLLCHYYITLISKKKVRKPLRIY